MKTVLVLCVALALAGCSKSSGSGGRSSSGIATEIRSAAAFLDSLPSKVDYTRRGYELRDAISRMPEEHSSAALALLNYNMAGEHLDMARESAANDWKDLYEQNIAAVKDLSAKMKANADDLD